MNCECLVQDIIDVAGLCDLSTIDLTTFPFWTEISVPETLIIPDQKPDIEQVDSVSIAVSIIRQKVIPTPISPTITIPTEPPTEIVETNVEGRVLTGRKLIVEGELCQTINYTALVPQQTVHSAHFVVPFSAYIVIPLTINGTDTLDLNFQVQACVEDVFVKEFSRRCIFKNVALLLQAIPAPISGCPDECQSV